MTAARSFTDPFKMVDVTPTINRIPNSWGLISASGMFEEEFISNTTVEFEQVDFGLSLVKDQYRGARNSVNADRNRKIHSFVATHHPLDDQLTAKDLSGVRAYGGTDAAETEQKALLRKLEDMTRKHDATLEAARVHTLVTGTQYAPNGTVTADFYTAFGMTRKVVDFALAGTGATLVMEKGEEVIAHIQDNLQTGLTAGGITMYCSPGFFSKVIKQAGVLDAYRAYSSNQEPLRQRLGGPDALMRQFYHSGVTYIEYRAAFNGVALIPANEAYAVPTNVPGFGVTYFSPAQKMNLVNTIGERRYAFTYPDTKNEFIELNTEQNFINLVKYPQAIVKCFTV